MIGQATKGAQRNRTHLRERGPVCWSARGERPQQFVRCRRVSGSGMIQDGLRR
jgi:hypothetical protein